MQKTQIDNYVNENYQLLLKVSSDFVRRKKRNFDPEIVISEAYIHVLKCKDKIETVGQLQSYFFSKINRIITITMMLIAVGTIMFKDIIILLLGVNYRKADI